MFREVDFEIRSKFHQNGISDDARTLKIQPEIKIKPAEK